jgi:hypothetical protein
MILGAALPSRFVWQRQFLTVRRWLDGGENGGRDHRRPPFPFAAQARRRLPLGLWFRGCGCWIEGIVERRSPGLRDGRPGRLGLPPIGGVTQDLSWLGIQPLG